MRSRICLSVIFALFICLAATLSACGDASASSGASSSDEAAVSSAEPSSAEPEEASTEAGSTLSFTATDLAGNAVTEEVFSGYKLTMLNIWATYCGPCIREMPELGKLSAEYEGKGLQIIGIISDSVDFVYRPVDSILETAQSIILQTGANYRHLVLSESLANCYLKGVNAVPTTYFVDEKGGIIGEAVVGSRSYEQWKAVFEKLLSEAE